MDKHAMWKWLILVGLLAFSIWVVWPPVDIRNAEGKVLYAGKIRLGLDLKGGTSFVVKIDEDMAREEIKNRWGDLSSEQIEEELKKAMSRAQERALEVLRNRVDSLGIAEPIIYPGKDNRIVIQLPGIDEEKRREAEQMIKSVAFLEFRMVHDDNETLVAKIFDKGLAPDGHSIVRMGSGERLYRRDIGPEKMDAAYRYRLGRFEVPDAGHEFMFEEVERDGAKLYAPVFVKRRREFSGEFLKTAGVDYRAMTQPVVTLEFDGQGAKKFARVTTDYAPGGPRNPDPKEFRRLAIILDGTLYSAPVIKQAIHGGRAEISGQFTLRDAQLLANILNAGSLPAPVRIVEKRFVDPSLGKDSIRSGVTAVALGGIGVLVFMLVYYFAAGVVADLALGLNMLLLPLGMVVAAGFLGIFAKDVGGGGGPIQLPVLTLPGIAGILLTIGMAVDANVLIFERIREESASGKRLWTAVTAGYDRAFVTIMDANLTTLITGVILFVFGSGPIRGFAVTLCAGILVSMFTALVVTKLFFGIIASKSKAKSLKMLQLLKDTSIDFVGKRKIAAVVSLVVIVGSWTVMSYQGWKSPGNVFGIDFTGGASITFKFKERVSVSDIRNALDSAEIPDVHVQFQKEMDGEGEYLLVKTGHDMVGEMRATEVVRRTLEEKFSDAGFTAAQEDEVGAQIGSELKTRAVWSIVLALLGIVVYITFRFELGFAVGAIVALAHDVLVTVGIYTLCGRQLSLPIVAALLTIVGYSVNDTIVVFDRIREDLRLVQNKTFKDICNLSINQTLSRTILTSLTTLITVVMLLVFGGGAINDFALALCIGVIVGTYSSIFVATPVVLLWHRDRRPEFAPVRTGR